MQLGFDVQIPDGLLAANALLAENSRQGFATGNRAPYQGLNRANCTAALGLSWSVASGTCSTHVMGRFMSPDPYMGSMDYSNPQSLNRYSYVLNNPLRFVDPTGLDCVYYSDDGTTVESIDHNSDPAECFTNKGNWEEGTTYKSWQHYDSNSDTWTGASIDSNNVYFYQGQAPGHPNVSQEDFDSGNYLFWCTGNCLSGTSTSVNNLLGQLQNGATLYGLLSWAVSQGPGYFSNPNSVGAAQSQFINGSGNNWCGAGGAGVPANSNDWSCLAHDYSYHYLGADWLKNNYDPNYAKGAQLQKINQALCNSVSGAGGLEIRLFFIPGPWGCR